MRTFMLLAVLLFGVVLAEEGLTFVKDAGGERTDFGHLDGLRFHPIFPINKDLRFEAGKPCELLLGFVNNLERHINFTYVDASLRNTMDEKDVIQNFTRQQYGINTPGKGTTVGIDYMFQPDPMLDAVPYVMIVEVAYKDGNNEHTEVVFNRTVTVVEADESLIHPETGFLLVIAVGILTGMYYFGRSYMSKKFKAPKSAESVQAAQNSFLEGTKFGKKSPNNKKSPKKK